MRYGTVFYSGGKDSHFALYNAIKKGYKIPFLVNFEPLPHSDGMMYFNCLYNKKAIETHSRLMSIPVCYYKFGAGIGRVFKDDRGKFLKEIIEFIKAKTLIYGIKKIKIFVPWVLDDIVSNKKTFKRYCLFKKVFERRGIDFEFSIEKETSVSIIKKTLIKGIKSICISVPEGEIKGMDKKISSDVKGLLGRNVDMDFLKRVISIETGIKQHGGFFPRQDIHSLVTSSPLFKRNIDIKRFSIYNKDSILSLKIFFV